MLPLFIFFFYSPQFFIPNGCKLVCSVLRLKTAAKKKKVQKNPRKHCVRFYRTMNIYPHLAPSSQRNRHFQTLNKAGRFTGRYRRGCLPAWYWCPLFIMLTTCLYDVLRWGGSRRDACFMSDFLAASVCSKSWQITGGEVMLTANNRGCDCVCVRAAFCLWRDHAGTFIQQWAAEIFPLEATKWFFVWPTGQRFR